MQTYSVKEASKKLGISTRAVQKRCVKDNIRKKSNQYLIQNEHLQKWFAEIEEKERTNEPKELGSQSGSQSGSLDYQKIEILLKEKKEENESLNEEKNNLENHILKLEKKLLEFKIAIEKKTIEIEDFKRKSIQAENLDREIKLYKSKIENQDKEIKELKEDNTYQLAPNERIELFTTEEYIDFERKLKEWHTLHKEIEYKTEIFGVEKKSLEEQKEFYKEQFNYQRKQAEKILEIHETLILHIQQQTTIEIQKTIIEAKEKGVINEDWKVKK